MTYLIHPIADILPMMGEEDYAKLRSDILRNGLINPITLYQDKILDGRARYKVCLEQNLTPEFCQWNGNGTPLDFVVSQNLSRRRLSDNQRAMAAARAMTPTGKGHPRAGSNPYVLTRDQLAVMFGVSSSGVTQSRIILMRGTKEDIALAESGKVSRAQLVHDIIHDVPPEKRIKERPRLQDRGARNTMTKMGQVAYQMLAEAEEKKARKRKPPTLVETPDAPVEVIREEVAIEDTLLTHVTALLKDTSLSPNQAAVILAKDMPPYPLGALIDWLTEIQERMHRIIRKQQRGEAA